MPFPSPNFVALFPIQEVIIDKDTDEPLSNGIVTFFEDNDRTVLKPIYQQTQLPDNTYTFVELNNPLILTSIGTFADDNGNDIIPFLYPYVGLPTDAIRGELDLYYITVYAANPPVGNGSLQFTREAWPPNTEDDSGIQEDGSSINQISNPQFVEVNFVQSQGLTVAISGSTTIHVAPDWDILTTGTGTVTIQQIIVTNSTIASNAPYALQIASSGTGVTIQMRQRISHSPRLFYNKYVSSYCAVASADGVAHQITLTYTASDGTPSVQLARDSCSADGSYTPISDTVQIIGTVNTDGADVGYVDFIVGFDAGITIRLTSFQMVEVTDENKDPGFFELSSPRQEDFLFHYYKPQLFYKPIPSYTLGWDFPFNPCQELSTTVGVSTLPSNNQSRYIADQTIAFEAIKNVLSYVFNASTGMGVSTATNTQFSIIQYLGSRSARELLSSTMAMQVEGLVTSGTIVCNLSIYYTNDSTLPDITSGGPYLSIVNTMSAGLPSSLNGTWTKVNRGKLGQASFTISSTTAQTFNFNGWDATSNSLGSVQFLAVVMSFNTLLTTQTVRVNYATLMSGDIATVPPPMTREETLMALREYYEKSYNLNTTPPSATLTGALSFPMGNYLTSTAVQTIPQSFNIQYTVAKRANVTPTVYPTEGTLTAGDVTIYLAQSLFDGTGYVATSGNITLIPGSNPRWTVTASNNGANYQSIGLNSLVASTGVSLAKSTGWMNLQYIADARYGVV